MEKINVFSVSYNGLNIVGKDLYNISKWIADNVIKGSSKEVTIKIKYKSITVDQYNELPTI